MDSKGLFLYLCSPLLPKYVRGVLAELGGKGFDIPECSRLAEPVSSHPDMLFSELSDGTLITEGAYFSENKGFFESLPFYSRIKPSVTELSPKYPYDVAFDVIRHDGLAIGRSAYIAPEITADATAVIDVKQGYALCSTLKTERFAITADKHLHNVLADNNCETLLISGENIRLNGYDCGFIGGASCVIEKLKTIVFFGNLEMHPDFLRIKKFIENFGYKLMYPKDIPLEDFGGIKII